MKTSSTHPLLCLILAATLPCLVSAVPADLLRKLKLDSDNKYAGYKVLAVIPNSEDEVAWLADYKKTASGTGNCSLDWWSEPSLPTVTVSLAVNPGCVDDLVQEFRSVGLSVRTTIPDLEQLIALEKNYRFLSQLYRDPYKWNDEVYHSLAEIEEHVDYLVEEYPQILSKKQLATTYEGRKIEVVIVREPGPVTKPVIWIDCGIHAREWVSPPTCMHAIEQLIFAVNSVDPSEENLLALFDFYILPVANPDGYVYSWTKDRMWRKNRRPIAASEKQGVSLWGGWGQSNAKCDYGVDPNRNFPINFHGEGASKNPCDDSYHGTQPFTEAESQAIRNGVKIMHEQYGKGRVAAFVSIHAYSQFWMSPYGKLITFFHDKSSYFDSLKILSYFICSLASN